MPYIIRKMEPEEISIAIQFAEEEGWNPGKSDADCFYRTDPSGFLVGELDGEIIACKSCVRYQDQFGFMGFYIVRKPYRGLGYGYKIWLEGFNRLKDILSGMDGVVAQQPNYMKSGYKLAYRQIRFEGKGLKGKENHALINAEDVSFSELDDFDASIFPARRTVFLKEWMNMKKTKAKLATTGNKITGYGVIRPCVKGFKIGPLFANDLATAEEIFLSLVDFASGEEVYLDIPEINKPALSIVEKYNLKYVFETARMYNNGIPLHPVEKIFGVTTFELG